MRNLEEGQHLIAMSIRVLVFGQKTNKTKPNHVTHCSLQWNFDEQMYSGEVGKIEEWSGTFVEEGGRTRDTR